MTRAPTSHTFYGPITRVLFRKAEGCPNKLIEADDALLREIAREPSPRFPLGIDPDNLSAYGTPEDGWVWDRLGQRDDGEGRTNGLSRLIRIAYSQLNRRLQPLTTGARGYWGLTAEGTKAVHQNEYGVVPNPPPSKPITIRQGHAILPGTPVNRDMPTRPPANRDLPPGTALKKKGCVCTVQDNGYEFNGTLYTSLSAAAIMAARSLGSTVKRLNGWTWWGVERKAERSRSKPPKSSAPRSKPRIVSDEEWRQIPLGQIPDHEAGALLGQSESAAFKVRTRFGIPAYKATARPGPHIDWASQPLLGKVSDTLLARTLKVAKSTVGKARRTRGLPIPPSLP